MSIFLSKDNQIIRPHLNHMLKSYHYTTGYSVYAYNAEGVLIDKSTRTDFRVDSEWIDSIAKDIVLKQFSDGYTYCHMDSLLLEVNEDIFTIAVPVFAGDKLITFLMLEPFLVTNVSTMDKKLLYDKLHKKNKLPLSYQAFRSLVHIHRDRLNYLGQLFYHLMSHSIYIGQQHFMPKDTMRNTKWGKTLSLDSLEYTDGFINLPVVEQICDYLAIKDIKGALNTYQVIQTFLQVPGSNQCPIRMLKYQLVAIITLMQYHLSQHFKEMSTSLYRIANDCILQLNQYNGYSAIFQYGELIIEKFYQVIKEHQALDLSPNILQALEYIHTHYMNNIRLTDVAESIPMNETYLSAQFKQEFKIPFKQYLNQYRIKQAAILIKSTSYSVTDIALMVGFDTTNYFSTVFKKYTSHTPSQYLKKYRSTHWQVQATSIGY